MESNQSNFYTSIKPEGSCIRITKGVNGNQHFIPTKNSYGEESESYVDNKLVYTAERQREREREESGNISILTI
jgi:hypothetical protein